MGSPCALIPMPFRSLTLQQTPKGVSAEQLRQAGIVYFKDGQMLCTNPARIFFNDLRPKHSARWVELLKPEPLDGWEAPITYMGWRDVPSVYVVCESDLVVPSSLQEHFAKLAGSRIMRISAGHMAQVSQLAMVAGIVHEVARCS
jgi:hypothetical protein